MLFGIRECENSAIWEKKWRVLMMMGRRCMQLCITYYACAAFDFLNVWYNVSAVL